LITEKSGSESCALINCDSSKNTGRKIFIMDIERDRTLFLLLIGTKIRTQTEKN
jgi:hypothetical protein